MHSAGMSRPAKMSWKRIAVLAGMFLILGTAATPVVLPLTDAYRLDLTAALDWPNWGGLLIANAGTLYPALVAACCLLFSGMIGLATIEAFSAGGASD